MSDEHVFPLLPTVWKYWTRMDRVRSRDPPPFGERPLDLRSTGIGEAAARILLAYIRWPGRYSFGSDRPAVASRHRVRDRRFDGLCLFLAAGWPHSASFFVWSPARGWPAGGCGHGR